MASNNVSEQETRRLRVYDDEGDFLIDIPKDAKVTFGYFNPSRDGGDDGAFSGGPNRYRTESRRTALRIYQGTDKHQLAVFLGVKGFRDESLELTRLQETVTITQSLVDDPETGMDFQRSQKKQMKAIPESTYR